MDEPDLFSGVTERRAHRSRLPGRMSVALHALALAPIVMLPMHPGAAPPPVREYIVLRQPPPPPPLPLAGGPGLTNRPPRVAATPAPETPVFTQPVETPPSAPPTTLAPEDASESGGDPEGTDAGDPAGMLGGQPDGMVGGVPGGLPGGVPGGTGTLPVPVSAYDQPPRLLRMVRPEYPRQAFLDKTEGEVVLEILIDAHGRVVWTRVVRSIPALDAAAQAAVREWVFVPAIAGGRPVAVKATTPVTFRLY